MVPRPSLPVRGKYAIQPCIFRGAVRPPIHICAKHAGNLRGLPACFHTFPPTLPPGPFPLFSAVGAPRLPLPYRGNCPAGSGGCGRKRRSGEAGRLLPPVNTGSGFCLPLAPSLYYMHLFRFGAFSTVRFSQTDSSGFPVTLIPPRFQYRSWDPPERRPSSWQNTDSRPLPHNIWWDH